MIGVGAALVSNFSWVLYLFGFFLVVTGLRKLVMAEKTPDLEKNPVLRSYRAPRAFLPTFWVSVPREPASASWSS